MNTKLTSSNKQRKSKDGASPGRELNRILQPEGIEVRVPVSAQMTEILTPDAVRFVAKLVRQFSAPRESLLQKRAERQAEIDAGVLPDFLPETEELRRDSWTVASVPQDLQDRRVEITGPVGRKMVINALNSGAKVYMADFEDAHSPEWESTIQGQVNVRDAVNRTIQFVNPQGVIYSLKKDVATLLIRPRGWHLLEKHLLIDGKPAPAGIFDFGLYFYHNAGTLLEKGTGPYFYLPKLENHLEARLWNDVFVMAQTELGIPQGTIKATVLIETILAAFEMHEILYELRQHSAGLNCGRWDYIFSFIKKFHKYPSFILPDRAQVTMARHFLRSYSLLAIQTCHRRGIHAIGGMAPQIPIKNNPEANAQAIGKVIDDKDREAGDGHDGTWVAHPGLVPVAAQVFDAAIPGAHQIHVLREDVRVTAADLLKVPAGTITETGLRTNLSVGVQYLEAWLRGNGCVPLYHLMEDAATSEISRAQVWQWIRHGAALPDGRKITVDLALALLREEMDKIRSAMGEAQYAEGRYSLAGEIFGQLITKKELVQFLTLPAYEHLS